MSAHRAVAAPPPTPTRQWWPGWLRRLFGGSTPISATPAADSAEVPQRIGRYQILHKLGEGGMGIVYAAEDSSLGRKIAVKTIAHPDPDARTRFWREARAAASVSHPHVCQVFEIGEDAGRLFIAMELLQGESLSDRLRRGPFPVAGALTLAPEMLSALAAV